MDYINEGEDMKKFFTVLSFIGMIALGAIIINIGAGNIDIITVSGNAGIIDANGQSWFIEDLQKTILAGWLMVGLGVVGVLYAFIGKQNILSGEEV
jgi:hypothetical protein